MNILIETLQVRREWHDILNMLKERKKKPKPKILYSVEPSFRNEGDKDFLYQTKVEEVHCH